jgi:hypothetical protein
MTEREGVVVEEAKNRFLASTRVADEATALKKCLLAAFRRNKLYKDGIAQSLRKELRDSLRDELRKLSGGYRRGAVSEVEHEANILHLSEEMSKQYGSILVGDRFNIGTSQKALNVYLKFLWCLGQLSIEPVHRPLDRIILKRASINGSWTSLDDIEIYRSWINQLRDHAKPVSLSHWELTVWPLSLWYE